jgi:hypothetical protein
MRRAMRAASQRFHYSPASPLGERGQGGEGAFSMYPKTKEINP